ncbi:peptide-N4-(N-acetyl-beta-glucosaminyl)asparagine amidase A-like [Phoenix dactylifera]|uniref:Peptide-N4-(N-acetyl-beta- glucosaminyl)asparagine amidase A-like n=1 Tax=Phoenix dactylifera TaxID=42345 RepID=A0A8B7C8Z7_PHODC|nr:peptide-N4-(N-acetyl-beta-glucosaminyl)asparagine amidase A-like [Phoenix dactylifera]
MATFTYAVAGPVPIVSLKHLDPTLPPVLAGQNPTCSLLVLQKDFADTVGSPPASANYTQPRDCPFPWTRVVLELSVSASDLQKDRVAAIWIDGAEVLRTATPRPMAPGAFWRVRKDITRYATLLRRVASGGGGALSMMLENSNDILPGVFSANVSLHFYRGALSPSFRRLAAGFAAHPSIKGLYSEPADLIVPVSNPNGYYRSGFWLRIDNETHVPSTAITIPRNTYRAVLEIFVSYHGDDEFWYTNPLRSAYRHQPLPSNLSTPRANGGFRQVYATVDGRFVGGHIPFAVLYPSSINPYFWSPVAAIGAFDMPSYDLDLTPFLGFMLDGRPHDIGLGVQDAQPFWLVSANLHLWVDAWSDSVQAGLIEYISPPIKMNRNAEWRDKEGQSEINAEGLFRFTGWVSSSKGNLTTQVSQKIKFKGQVEVQNRGSTTQIELQNKERMMVAIQKGHQLLGRVQLYVEAPLQVQTSMVSAAGGALFQKSRLYHQLTEMVTLSEGQAMTTSTLTDRQDAEGSALMHGDAPVWGSGSTKSSYRYKDGSTCYLRNVNTAGGAVMMDTKSASCAAVADA